MPCKVKCRFIFKDSEWVLDGHKQTQHNHAPDKSILPNSIIFYIDDYVCTKPKTSPAEIA